MRHCSKCQQKKPATDFRRYGIAKLKTRSECKECESIQGRFKRDAHKVAGKNPGRCHCCQKETQDLVVDHCHNTGVFRGWLCRNCNTGIGKLGDTCESLVDALNYLLRSETYNNGLGMCEIQVTTASTDEMKLKGRKILDRVCNGVFDENFVDGEGI